MMSLTVAVIIVTTQLYYPFTWGAFDGDTPVVNGKVYPYFEVKPQAYRFRFLNGCNSRYVSLSIPDGPAMMQVRCLLHTSTKRR
jgi:FtsP/CotA-like multicopper oxidase with cupredoxin domain